MRFTRKAIFLAAVFLALGVAGGYLFVRMEGEAPTIEPTTEIEALGRRGEWSFVASDGRSGLREVRAWVSQGERRVELFAEEIPSRAVARREVRIGIDPAAHGLADGPATLIAAARDHSLRGFKGNTTFLEVPVRIDTVAPRVEPLSTQHYVNRGGAGLAVFRIDEEGAAAGVEVDGRLYRAYPAGGALPGVHLAYFAIRHDAPAAPAVALVARDAAGNETRRSLPHRLREKRFPSDRIRISAGFLDRKLPEFRAADPALPADPIEAFLAVNRQWRSRDHAEIDRVCSAGAAERLWAGPFLQMPNTKNMAGWAEGRTYLDDGGREIDAQTHLGIDLASTAGAPVPAANAGVVAFAGTLGIYGEAVILDHGQGLFSLYGHLGGLRVAAGDPVGRGAVIGTSGQTGMAGGDHLHFSVLVGGTFVDPAEWLDGHWIDDNVENKLALAGAR